MDIPFVLVIVVAIAIAIALKKQGVIRARGGLGGVCGGIAEHYDLSVAGVRVLWVLGSLALGCGIITYIVLWCILPRRK